MGELNKVIFAKKIFIFLKQVFTYVLLFSLVVRPLFIVGHIAYYELNIDYITEKFCENKDKPQLQCNGKCHLAKELSVVTAGVESDSGNEVKLINSYKSFTPLFFQKSKRIFLDDSALLHLKNKSFYFYSNDYSFTSKIRLLRPPIV